MAGSLPPASVPSRAVDVLSATLDDETVLYDPATSRPVLLNVTAAAVWSAVDGRRSVGDISSMLAAEFGSDPDVVAEGVVSVLRALVDAGLVACTI